MTNKPNKQAKVPRAEKKPTPAEMARSISKARINGLAFVALYSACSGWALASYGIVALAVTAGLTSLAVAIALWNTLPVLYKPDARYKATPAERLRWPEAAPVEPSGKNKRLILCIHGFPSTPADFRKLVAVSDAHGWDIAAPLLPGCGTQPADLLTTEWAQYQAMVSDTWRRLRPRYDQACIVGISMGGALTLGLAEEACADPAMAPLAITTIGAPAVLNSWYKYGLITSPLIYFARILGKIVPSMGTGYPDPLRDEEDGGGEWKGYTGIFTRQTHSLQLGMREVERNLPRITCPALVCHGRGDRIVDFRNAGIIMSRLGSSDIEAYIANMDKFCHNRHNLLLYESQRERLWARILEFFDSRAQSAQQGRALP